MGQLMLPARQRAPEVVVMAPADTPLKRNVAIVVTRGLVMKAAAGVVALMILLVAVVTTLGNNGEEVIAAKNETIAAQQAHIESLEYAHDRMGQVAEAAVKRPAYHADFADVTAIGIIGWSIIVVSLVGILAAGMR